MAVERAVVQALGLEEDHRIVVLDARDQQALGVVRVGRHHRAQAADVREHRLGRLAVRLAAVDAAAAGHADRHRGGEVAGRAVAQARRLGHDLVGRRIEVVGELDLDDRAQAVRAHAHRGTDDAAFGDRRIEHARLAVLLLQAFGAAEHAAEVAHVLAEHHHVGVALEHHVHRRTQRLDHRHRRGRARGLGGERLLVLHFHDQTPSSWRWRRRCSGISL